MVKQRPRTSRGVKKQNKHSRTVWKHVERAVHRESIDRRDGRGVDSNTEPVTASARSAEHELGDHGSGGPEHKASTNLWGSDYGQPKHRQVISSRNGPGGIDGDGPQEGASRLADAAAVKANLTSTNARQAGGASASCGTSPADGSDGEGIEGCRHSAPSAGGPARHQDNVGTWQRV